MASKHDAPPFRMVIDNGRLVPATPFDQERLDSFRNGLKVKVTFVGDADRVGIRKWWAIISKAVKVCKTPWKTADSASDAIKLAIGVTTHLKTVGDQWREIPRSLSELDDAELDEAVEDMQRVLFKLTGVDPATLRKEAKVDNEV